MTDEDVIGTTKQNKIRPWYSNCHNKQTNQKKKKK